MAFLLVAQAVAWVLVAVVAVPKRKQSDLKKYQDVVLPASKRLEIQVHIHMVFQWCWCWKSFSTLFTFVGHVSIGCVLGAYVAPEVRIIVEQFATLFTGDCRGLV